MKLRAAVKAIQAHGILTVFPINNKPAPQSLWSVFYPKSKLRWEWDEAGDDRLSKLWGLREELSRSNQVIYTKWYQGRATFFSREIFTAMLSALGSTGPQRSLSRPARHVLETLEMDSPLSTKILKKLTELSGRANEATYERALRELWRKLLIVAYGEVHEGAFPSLALGATRLLFEDLWTQASALDRTKAERLLREQLGPDSLFFRWYLKTLSGPKAPSAAMPA